MPDLPRSPLRSFIREIHRRSLWQVLGIYIIGAWVALQASVVLRDAAGLPEWFPTLALALLIIGLPVVLATAFVQEGGPGHHAKEDVGATPAGEEDASADAPAREGSVGARFFTWRNAFLGGVGAFAVLGIVGTGWVLLGGEIGRAPGAVGGPESVGQSIAVLPFEDLSPEGDQQYFVEGLSEEIINALTQIGDLKVSARTSAFAFQESGLDIRTIADSLGVANVLEGSVRRDGDQIRITAQLIEAETGFHLWSDNFDRELTAIFEVQDEIAQNIASRLQVTFAGGPNAQLVTQGSENPEAHEAYLRGRFLWNQRTVASLRSAIEEFEAAIDLDPAYANAWSGLADSHSVMVNVGALEGIALASRPEAEAALQAARRAVELSPESGMAQTSLARALLASGEWDAAERAFARALELSPGYASAHQWYGLFLNYTGRPAEAVGSAEEAVRLDPVSRIVSWNLGIVLTGAGRFDDGIEQMRRTIQLDPNWVGAWSMLGWQLYSRGEVEEGREATSRWLDLSGLPPEAQGQMMEVLEATGRFAATGEPQPIPEAVASIGIVGTMLAAGTGNWEQVLVGFERLIRDEGHYEGAAGVHTMLTDMAEGGAPGALAPAASEQARALIEDPRYQALLEEANITW